jgi:hypothetical protein
VSLTRKLVLAFLLVSTVPLGAVIGVLYFTSVKHAKEQVDTRLEDSVIQVGKSVDEFMFSCTRGMRDLAEDAELSSGDRNAFALSASRRDQWRVAGVAGPKRERLPGLLGRAQASTNGWLHPAKGLRRQPGWQLAADHPHFLRRHPAPVTQSFNRTFGILLATLVGAVGLGFGWRAT